MIARADAEVADREHVGPLEVEHQEHVRAPDAEALDRYQLGDHLLVGQPAELVQLERAVEHVLGQRAQEADLGARQPGRRAQLVGVVGQDLLGRWRAAAEAIGEAP